MRIKHARGRIVIARFLVACFVVAPFYFHTGARVSLFEVGAGLVIAFLAALCMPDKWID